MKKLEIKTEKSTLLVVDLPTGSIWVRRSGISFPNGKGGEHFISGNFKHLGKVSEITEEEWKGIVDTGVDFVKETTHFIDYEDDSSLYRTAAMSGLSLLKANGVLLGNKYHHPDTIKIQPASLGWYKDQLDKHNLEQQKVWSNPHVFIKTL